MISHQFNCVFVHIPKTAGQSIEHFFLNLHNLTWKEKDQLLLKKNTDPQKGPERLAHMTAKEYYQCGHIEQKDYQHYFSFSFVRNPWERLVSEYLHKKIDKKMSLKEFVLHGWPSQNIFCDKYRHIIPQADYLYDEYGQQLVDFIGRFENLHNDFSYVCKQLNIADTSLPHKNSSYGFRRLITRKFRHLFRTDKRVNSHYSEYYDDELQEIVAEIYAKDIELFGYEFDKPAYNKLNAQVNIATAS
ncbi:sulfotransferase family protein [Thalassotalea profundi]|uniref:Sulfotransferase family protein n=1 Tax=Thalassotalea profundi TaxID=2036687 RepID=A0ABQ3IG84_9GAMM|nr:sulfotransferase family protein [Thalassotalea profundi]GHE80262.1 hypothetical protein GCM10011501_05140 [Thalassotalea profundi]